MPTLALPLTVGIGGASAPFARLAFAQTIAGFGLTRRLPKRDFSKGKIDHLEGSIGYAEKALAVCRILFATSGLADYLGAMKGGRKPVRIASHSRLCRRSLTYRKVLASLAEIAEPPAP